MKLGADTIVYNWEIRCGSPFVASQVRRRSPGSVARGSFSLDVNPIGGTMAERLELTGPAFASRAVSFMNLPRTRAFQKDLDAGPAGVALREFQLKLRRNRTRIVFHVLVIAASATLLSACTTPRETKFPRLDVTSRVKSEPKIVCTNCVCDPDGKCFCATCTITAE